MAGDSQRTGSPLGAPSWRRLHTATPAASRPAFPRRTHVLTLALREAPSIELVLGSWLVEFGSQILDEGGRRLLDRGRKGY